MKRKKTYEQRRDEMLGDYRSGDTDQAVDTLISLVRRHPIKLVKDMMSVFKSMSNKEKIRWIKTGDPDEH